MYEIKNGIRISGKTIPLSDTFTNIFANGLEAFEYDILMGHNNHNLLQHFTTNNNPVISINNNALEYTVDTPEDCVCLGACLVYPIENFNANGFYSIKNNKGSRDITSSSLNLGNLRFVLFNDEFDYNQVFVHYQYHFYDGEHSTSVVEYPVEGETYINAVGNVYFKSGLTLLRNFKVMFFFQTSDDIIGVIDNTNFFVDNGKYSLTKYIQNNERMYKLVGNYDKSKLSGANPDEKILTFEKAFYNSEYYLFNKMTQKQVLAMCNASGFYYTDSEFPTSSTLNEKLKIGYMDANRNIDVYRTLTGLTEINSSDTYNKDLTKLPEWQPSGERDKIDSMTDNLLYSYQSSMLTKYYKVSSANLINLSNAITTNTPQIPEGLNVFDNIVSVSILPFDVSEYCRNPISDTIKIYNWDSQVNALRLDTQTTNRILATIHIDRNFNDFRDFEPYTTHKVYLPLYGVVDLPNFCVGRNVQISIQSDTIHGKFTYVLGVGDTNFMIFDKISVNCSASLDFTAITSSLKSLNVTQSQMNLLGNVISGVSSATTSNVFGVAQSVVATANSFNSLDVAKNKSYTQHTGVNSAVSDLFDTTSIYYIKIKSTFEDFDAHTNGYLYCKRDTIRNHSGFCICSNADVELNATETEKEMIKQILESGFEI